MPGVIRAAVPVGTLPYSLSIKFSESRAVQMNMNEYHDGSCQRVSLVTGSRRTWKLPKRLDAFHLGLLRTFCNTVQGGAFNFYNPFETLPAFTKNPIGTAGLYLVRFNSDWSQINGMGRSECDLEIIEVSATGAIDIGAPIIPGAGPGGGGGGGVGGGTPTAGPGAPIDPINQAYLWSPDQQWVGYGPLLHGGVLWTYGIAGTDNDYPGGPGVYRSPDGTTWAMQTDGVPLHYYGYAAYVDSSAGTITILLLGVFGEANLVEFDMNLGTYGSLSPTATLGSTSASLEPILWHINLFKLSNGGFRVVYEVVNQQRPEPPLFRDDATDAEVYWLDYFAGSWTAQTLIVGSAGNYYTPASIFQDGDTIHLFYADRGAGLGSYDGNIEALQGFQYIQIAASGTMSSPVAIDSVLGADGTGQWVLNTGIVSGNKILIPVARKFTYIGDDTTPTNMGVLVGTPKDNPAFTFVPIPSALVRNDRNFGPFDLKVIHLGSVDYFAWMQGNYDSDNDSLIYLSKSLDGGSSWSTPQLLLSLDVTPPIDGSPERDIINFSLGTQLDGSLGLEYTTTAMTYYAPVSFT